jgi:hypothetical protein
MLNHINIYYKIDTNWVVVESWVGAVIKHKCWAWVIDYEACIFSSPDYEVVKVRYNDGTMSCVVPGQYLGC